MRPFRNKPKTTKSSHFPFLSFFAIVFAVLSTGLAVLILKLSDGQPVQSWKIAPTVYLAVITTAINQLLRLAFRQGATASWWKLALRGATIAELQREWEYANELLVSITPKRPFSITQGAALAVAALMVNGPLLQRASTVTTIPHSMVYNISLPIRVQPFWNLTEIIDVGGVYQPEFGAAVLAAQNREPMSIPAGICNGTCSTVVTVAGFARDCVKSTIPCRDVPLGQSMKYALAMQDITTSYLHALDGSLSSRFWCNGNGSYTDNRPDTPQVVPYFQLDIPPQMDGGVPPDQLNQLIPLTGNLSTYFYDKSTVSVDGNTEFVAHICSITAAFIDLNITIANNAISVINSPNGQVKTVEVMPTWFSFPLGFGTALGDRFNGALAKIGSGTSQSGGIVGATIGSSVRTYINQSSSSPSMYGSELTSGSTWTDPTHDYLSYLDELCIRYALQRIPDTPHRIAEWQNFTVGRTSSFPSMNTTFGSGQTVQAAQQSTIVVYQVIYAPVIAALAVTVLTAIGVSANLMSWRHLGREFSLSPLETARAFDAPILRDAGGSSSSSSAKGIIAAVGNRRVKYKVVRDHSSELDDNEEPSNETTVEPQTKKDGIDLRAREQFVVLEE